MDKKSILAIILVVIVIAVSMIVQNAIFNKTEKVTMPEEALAAADAERTEQEAIIAELTPQTNSAMQSTGTNRNTEKFVYETNLFTITFDPVGASVSSMMMKEHADAYGEKVDLVFRGEGHNAFLLYWGNDLSQPVLDVFAYRIEGKKVIFTNTYKDSKGKSFTITKTFEFKEGEYMFAVNVDISGESGFSGLNTDGYSYTIGFEPQIGPAFTEMKNNAYNYRRVYIETYQNNGKLKKKVVKFSNGEFETSAQLKWISLTGKYFSVIAMPADDTLDYKYMATQYTGTSIAQLNNLYVARPLTEGNSNDTIYFYAGPQLKKYLNSYYNGNDNAWGLKNTNLDNAIESGSIFEWLENILKWALTLLHKIVPNYGIGIILLTIIIKILLWPLSKKSLTSTAKMQALAPKQKEIQEKYKDNPQRQNQEMAALYKQEGVSPLGGCLPMLLQFPILIAMYGLLNRHFELRGAMFIPGWIPDLSVPETIATLGFKIPLLGTNEIHLLPILYTASMIFSMKITQLQSPGSAQGGGAMKFMTYAMPVIFFFVLYSAPSGLLLYWSVQNVLSMLQQFYTNARLRKDPNAFNKKKKEGDNSNEPAAVRKYQERLKMLEEAKAKAAKDKARNNKKK